jgi:hypothetical protein
MSALPPKADIASSVFMSTRPSSMQAAVAPRFGRRAESYTGQHRRRLTAAALGRKLMPWGPGGIFSIPGPDLCGAPSPRKPELILNLGYDCNNNSEFGITWA